MQRVLLICFIGLSQYAMQAQEKRSTNTIYTAQELSSIETTNSYVAELSKHFSKYELVELNTSSLYDQARNEEGQFQFQLKMAAGHVWDITAERYDVRSASYQFIVEGLNGRETLPRSPTITYKGFVNSDPSNNLRMTITSDYISALFMDGTHLYNIEPITQYVQQGVSTHYVVYESTAIKSDGFKCGAITSVDQQTMQQVDQLEKEGFNVVASACAQAEVALATTSDFVTKKGGGTKAGTEAYLLNFFNKAELYYAALQNKNVLAGIVVSLSTQTDMTNSNDPATIKSDFVKWATPGNGFSGISHDVGIIITSKIASGVIGTVTFQGLCATDKTWRYGFVDVVVGPQNLAHEEGHFWGSPHDNDALDGYLTNNPNTCPTNDCVMVPSNGFLGPVGKWSAKTIAYMEAWKTGQASACVNPCTVYIPTAAFASDKNFGCGSLTVKFTDQSTNNPTSWSWDFGDLTPVSTLQNPTHTYSKAGTYTVKLTATNSAGNNSVTKTTYVTVGIGQLTSNTYKVGPVDTTYGKGGYFLASGSLITEESDRRLLFDATNFVVLKSIKVYANTAGQRSFQVIDNKGANVKTVVVNVSAGESRVTLNISLAPGTNYALKHALGSISGLWRTNTGGTSFPYTVNSGLISITNTDANVNDPAANPKDFYYFFYDWEVVLEGCDTKIGITETSKKNGISIYPNPSAGIFNINYSGKEEKTRVEVYNLLGNKVYAKEISLGNGRNETLDMSRNAKGSYFVRIIGDSYQTTQRIIVE